MATKRKSLLTPWRVILTSIIVLVIAVWGTWLLIDGKSMDVLDPKGPIAEQQRGLIIGTVLLSIVVVIPVYTMLGVFAWKYREGNKKARYTPDVEGNRLLETIWWGIPIIIIVILSVITFITSHQLDPQRKLYSVKGDAVNVQVIALQWKWLFLYPDHGVASVNELRMPVGTPVNFEISADAPMSAFWIPKLGSQTYAMNGMSSKLSLQADEAGEFTGRNTNINGEGYSSMHFKVRAMPEQLFDTWLRTTEKTNESNNQYLDFEVYKRVLTRQEKDVPVKYFHLRDKELYDKIMQQFMPKDQQHGGGH